MHLVGEYGNYIEGDILMTDEEARTLFVGWDEK